MLEDVNTTSCSLPSSLSCRSAPPMACGDHSRWRLGLRRSIALLYWPDERYSPLGERSRKLYRRAQVCKEGWQIVNHADEANECCVVQWLRHMCYCFYFVLIGFHSLIWNNGTHEFEFLKLELKFGCIEVDVPLLTTFPSEQWIVCPGMWRKRSLMSAREKYFAALSL